MLRQLRVTVEGHAYDVTVEDLTDTGNQLYPDHRSMSPTNATAPVVAPTASAPAAHAPQQPAAVAGSGTAVRAPMSGVLHEIRVKAGDRVDAGQVVAVMEAMKLKSPIVVDAAGTVEAVVANAGEAIEAGATILTLA